MILGEATRSAVFDPTITMGNVIVAGAMLASGIVAMWRFTLAHAQVILRLDKVERQMEVYAVPLGNVAVLQAQLSDKSRRMDNLEERLHDLEKAGRA